MPQAIGFAIGGALGSAAFAAGASLVAVNAITFGSAALFTAAINLGIGTPISTCEMRLLPKGPAPPKQRRYLK